MEMGLERRSSSSRDVQATDEGRGGGPLQILGLPQATFAPVKFNHCPLSLNKNN